jgi:hypothetical protein
MDRTMDARVPEDQRDRINRRLRLEGNEGALLVDESLPAEHQGMVSHLRAYAARKITEITAEENSATEH